jgi:predicted nucleotidyltransferase
MSAFEAMVPDIELARRFVAAKGPPHEVLLCGITGAHIYGFASPDSDIDMKGVHIVPTAQLLTLEPKIPAYDKLEVFEGTECDLTTHEVARALATLLRGDGNVLERILSPYQLVDSPAVSELQDLAAKSC